MTPASKMGVPFEHNAECKQRRAEKEFALSVIESPLGLGSSPSSVSPPCSRCRAEEELQIAGLEVNDYCKGGDAENPKE